MEYKNKMVWIRYYFTSLSVNEYSVSNCKVTDE
jgi:hypothetical protein